jgi:transcriptional regulator with GAF, ATPase, and Fis domain
VLKFLVESPYERKLYRIGGDLIVIGRSRAAGIPLLDEAARKKHVELKRTREGWRFRDLTAGATRHNGKAAAEGPLVVGDRLTIGSTVVTLQAVLTMPPPGPKQADSLPAAETQTPTPSKLEPVGGRSVRLDPVDGDRFTAGGLRSVLEINKRLVRERNEKRLLARIMDAAIDLTGAERGFLLLAGKEGLRVSVAHNLDGNPLTNPGMEISRTIARHAIAKRRAVLSDDAGTDERWSGMESVVALRLRSVLSVPLVTEKGVLGALYLDNRLEKGLFSERHLSLLEAFADQAALAIVNSRLNAGMRRRGKELEKKNQEVERLNARLAAELTQVREDLRSRQAELEFRYDYSHIVGRSRAIHDLLKTLDKITDLNVPVFIEGESGTGKELVARALHFNGSRREAMFVSENCSAIPETLIEKVLFGHVKGAFTGADHDAAGLFEQADGGTLFLDEVGDMSQEMQKKILRVLQEGEVRRVGGKQVKKLDVRIVAATNRDVDGLKESGEFREDLFFRLVVVRIRIPPLRERPDDLPVLVDHFLKMYCEEMGMALKTLESGALDRLAKYPWPGNVRELSNEIRRAVALSGERIAVESLSERVRNAPTGPSFDWDVQRPLKEVVEEVEKTMIARELTRQDGNKTRAAEVLGLSRLGLRNKIERYGLSQ